MRPLFAVILAVAFSGCQDLSDYPDKTITQPGAGSTQTSTRPDDYVPQGCRTITGPRDLSCFAGEPVEFRIQITAPPGEFVAHSSAPAGMFFHENGQYHTEKDGWFVILEGSPTTPGKYQISIDLQNDHGTSRCWVTLTVSAARQAVSQ